MLQLIILYSSLRPPRVVYIQQGGTKWTDWKLVKEKMIEKDAWVVKVKGDLQRIDTIQTAEMQHWDKLSIYRVPKSIRDLNKKAYNPQYVSFGPYHHGEEHLKPMEEHKHRALLHFLKRSNKPLESYFKSLAEVVQSLKDSYESLDLVWENNTDGFLQMMIVDGCFMIEVLRYFTEKVTGYADNDPIFSAHGQIHVVPYIRRDMLMLENQLPMLLLNTILDEETKQDEEFVNTLILKFWGHNTQFSPISHMGKSWHLLDVYRKMLAGKESRDSDSSTLSLRRFLRTTFMDHEASRMDHEASTADEIIRSASDIKDAGVNFKRSKTQSLNDISFNGQVLRLPPILVNDTTESMFLNLIAFERFHVAVENMVTSYVFFMDGLIDTAEDVRLLHEKGIIQNAIGSDKAAAKLFNSIAKDTTIDPVSSLHDVYKSVDKYCKNSCNEWRAYAKHNYFRSPWTLIAVIAAVVLFMLTILQTVYSIVTYHHPPGPGPPNH